VETIGLRELNQNPSKVVARVRAGESIIVTDRGRPVLRMVPESEQPDTLARLVSSGQVRPPIEQGMPDLVAGLAPGVDSLSELIVGDRDRERNR
jgi:prevent-host-death family protein